MSPYQLYANMRPQDIVAYFTKRYIFIFFCKGPIYNYSRLLHFRR